MTKLGDERSQRLPQYVHKLRLKNYWFRRYKKTKNLNTKEKAQYPKENIASEIREFKNQQLQ
jgi:capsid portal protein